MEYFLFHGIWISKVLVCVRKILNLNKFLNSSGRSLLIDFMLWKYLSN